MEYDSAIKGNEVMIHAVTWMVLENLMLSEIRQSQKDKHCVIPFPLDPWSSHIPRQSRTVGGRAGESV